MSGGNEIDLRQDFRSGFLIRTVKHFVFSRQLIWPRLGGVLGRMSSKRCKIRVRSGDLISAVDGATCDDEASVARKTRHGNRTSASILGTFLIRSRYGTSDPCAVIPRKTLVQGSASGPKPFAETSIRWRTPISQHC